MARKLLESAATAKARSLLAVLLRQLAWRNMWVTLLSANVQKTLAATLVGTGTPVLDAADGVVLTVVNVWLACDFGGDFGEVRHNDKSWEQWLQQWWQR